MRRFGVVAVLLVLALHGGGALGQQRSQAQAITRALLPAPVSTEQTVELPDRTLHFTATAGSVPLLGDQGQVQAEIAVVAYRLDGADPQTRPVTFALNGGPGFASAWLHLGGLGPWRLPMTGQANAPSATPAVRRCCWTRSRSGRRRPGPVRRDAGRADAGRAHDLRARRQPRGTAQRGRTYDRGQ